MLTSDHIAERCGHADERRRQRLIQIGVDDLFVKRVCERLTFTKAPMKFKSAQQVAGLFRVREGHDGNSADERVLDTMQTVPREQFVPEAYQDLAFSDIAAIRVALDQTLADMDAPLAGVREVAFFPPMTGG